MSRLGGIRFPIQGFPGSSSGTRVEYLMFCLSDTLTALTKSNFSYETGCRMAYAAHDIVTEKEGLRSEARLGRVLLPENSAGRRKVGLLALLLLVPTLV